MNLREKSGMDLDANGAPPAAPACLYDGKVMHQRMRPFGHRFEYRVFSLMVDLDRLDEAAKLSSLFSVNRRNWVSFYEKDHLDEGESNLAETARRRFRDGGVEGELARILLVCYPRIFGWVFNPLSVYYGYDANGDLQGLIYEVSNTFGGRHRYVLPVREGELGPGGLRQAADKVFHVSPFIPMEMRYNFRMLPPGREIRWRILETSTEGPLLSATYTGQYTPIRSKTLAGLCGRIPFLTGSILLGIHWEALKLWLKGAKFIPDPGKLRPAPELTQLPNAKIRSTLAGDASLARPSTDGNGDRLHLQLKR